eukprot:g46129.t1
MSLVMRSVGPLMSLILELHLRPQVWHSQRLVSLRPEDSSMLVSSEQRGQLGELVDTWFVMQTDAIHRVPFSTFTITDERTKQICTQSLMDDQQINFTEIEQYHEWI